jgi:hypothetical protein
MPARATPKVLIVTAGVILAFIAVVCYSLHVFGGSSCANELLAEAVSPDGKLKAVVFQRDCGATTGFSTQVSVFAASAGVGNSAGNVFTSDTNHGLAPSGPGGGPLVKVNWRSPSVLVVSHHAAARVFIAEPQVGSVKVNYESLQQ